MRTCYASFIFLDLWDEGRLDGLLSELIIVYAFEKRMVLDFISAIDSEALGGLGDQRIHPLLEVS